MLLLILKVNIFSWKIRYWNYIPLKPQTDPSKPTKLNRHRQTEENIQMVWLTETQADKNVSITLSTYHKDLYYCCNLTSGTPVSPTLCLNTTRLTGDLPRSRNKIFTSVVDLSRWSDWLTTNQRVLTDKDGCQVMCQRGPDILSNT